MRTPSEFDSIRPFEPEELPEVFDRLTADPQFRSVVAGLYPQIPMEAIEAKMRSCRSNLNFRKLSAMFS